MSFQTAKHLTHNLNLRAKESGDQEVADLAKALQELVEGLESEMRDIKHALREIQDKVHNLR